MDGNNSFEMKAKITSLGEWNKPIILHDPTEMTPSRPEPPEFEIDPNYIMLSFVLADLPNSWSNMLAKRDEIKRLNLTVGDYFTIRVSSAK